MKYLIFIFCFFFLSCGCVDNINKTIRAGAKIKREGNSMPPLVKEQILKKWGKEIDAVKDEVEYLTSDTTVYLDSNTIKKIKKTKDKL